MSTKSRMERPHLRLQFQIDRIAFFSDAVIAIAITLMVLEIKIPSFGSNASLREIFSRFGNAMMLHLIALIVCFVSIANLWIRHHDLFEHIILYNKRLILVNLYFLFAIMFLPISISFLFSSNNPQQLKMLVFFLNLCLCNLTYFLLLLVVYNKKSKFSSYPVDEHVKNEKWIAMGVTITFALVCILVLFKTNWFYYPFILWWTFRKIQSLIKVRPTHARLKT